MRPWGDLRLLSPSEKPKEFGGRPIPGVTTTMTTVASPAGPRAQSFFFPGAATSHSLTAYQRWASCSSSSMRRSRCCCVPSTRPWSAHHHTCSRRSSWWMTTAAMVSVHLPGAQHLALGRLIRVFSFMFSRLKVPSRGCHLRDRFHDGHRLESPCASQRGWVFSGSPLSVLAF